MFLFIKFGLSALVIVAASEIAKRNSLLGALVASLPLTSLLAMLWLYQETKDAARVAVLSSQIFWLVLPSLLLFVILPLLIRRGVGFYAALAIASGCTVLAYLAMSLLLKRFGIEI